MNSRKGSRTFFQVIERNPKKKQPRTIVKHERFSKRELKMQRLRKWLNDNYSVYSFSKLKQSGKELIQIRYNGLTHAGFNVQHLLKLL